MQTVFFESQSEKLRNFTKSQKIQKKKMALLPTLLDAASYNPMAAAIRDNFGIGVHPHDLFSNSLTTHPYGHHSLLPTGYLRACDMLPVAQRMLNDTKTVANVTTTKDGSFQVCIDVHHFKPSEITVKTVNCTIVIEGRHEERQDDHGYVERHFVRKYTLPKEYETTDIHSTLSSDGILTVKAPPPPKSHEGKHYKTMPIHRTGPVHLSIQAAKKGEADEKTK
jgi:HSP20 family molecular chaperone IbpA